jgi:DNA-binding winged helix-turn-helix (wHTH) protein/tetratricopeptide (TPR) repeat protein
MPSQVSSGQVFRFGLFEADIGRNTLTSGGVRVKLQDQPFRVLIVLLERAGEIVSREELRQRLWPDGTFVDFDGSLNAILKKLRAAIDDDPDNPRFIETVPRRGYRFIAPVSVHHQGFPPAASEAVLVPVSTPSPGETFHASTTRFRLRSRLAMYVLAGLAFAVLAVTAWFAVGGKWFTARRGSAALETGPAVHLRKSVAILGFRNLSGRAEDAWLATALSEMLSTELAGGETLRLVSGEDVVNLRTSSPWSQSDTLDRATTARIGTALNSDVLVLGSYMTIGTTGHGQLRLDIRMQDAKTGEIMAEVAEIGTSQDLFLLLSRVGQKLRDRLGVPRLEDTEAAGVLAALPLDREAARFYALGIAKLRQFDALGAKDLLVQAAEADPKFSLAHAMLARAWGQLGYEQKRRQEAKKAFDLSTDLPRPQRMLVEGDYYESLGNHEKSASIYNALFQLFPDNVDYGLQLAAIQLAAGHGSEAVKTIAQLRRLPPPASDDPRIDLTAARVAKSKLDALALIHSALKKSSLQGRELVYAQARHDECLSLLYGENPQQARPVCEDAYQIFLAAGNRLAAADCLRLIADGEGTHGQFEEAIATYQQALGILADLGDHEKTGADLNNMAIDFANEGKLDRAEQLYQQAKSHFEQAGDRANEATALGNIADILYLRGDLNGAEKLYEQALLVERSLDPGSPGYLLYRLADLNLTQGRVQEAHRLAQEAVAAFPPEQGAYQYLTGAMIVLGQTLEAEGNLAEARKQFEQSLAIRQKIAAMDLVAETQAELGELALQEKHPDQAEPLLRSAVAEFEKEKSDPDASSAYTLLSRALLMEGKLDEARNAARRGRELSLTSSDPALKLPAAIQEARIGIASPNRAESAAGVQELRSTIATAQRLGYYQVECEARMALGEFELKTNPSLGHKHLTTLASEMRSRGLELLARQAEAVVASGLDVVAGNRSGH